MYAPCVTLHFTSSAECSITDEDGLLFIWSTDRRSLFILSLTGERRDAIRAIVRGWDQEDESQAHDEAEADDTCRCGMKWEDHGPCDLHRGNCIHRGTPIPTTT